MWPPGSHSTQKEDMKRTITEAEREAMNNVWIAASATFGVTVFFCTLFFNLNPPEPKAPHPVTPKVDYSRKIELPPKQFIWDIEEDDLIKYMVLRHKPLVRLPFAGRGTKGGWIDLWTAEQLFAKMREYEKKYGVSGRKIAPRRTKIGRRPSFKSWTITTNEFN